jgi:DUF1009 family protein
LGNQITAGNNHLPASLTNSSGSSRGRINIVNYYGAASYVQLAIGIASLIVSAVGGQIRYLDTAACSAVYLECSIASVHLDVLKLATSEIGR